MYTEVMEYCLEIAQSHDGSVGYVHGLLESLKKREIKLVKFQMHFPEYESTDLEVFRSNFSIVDKSRFDYWKRTSFTPKEWRTIFDKCSELNIEFLCTPLSKFAVEILEDLGVKRYKIASGDFQNFELIESILTTKKDIILSTGMSTESEIKGILQFLDHSKITLLQCTSKYPASLSDAGLKFMQKLIVEYPNLTVGFSDHTGNPLVAIWALCAGAKFVEQHIVYSKEQFGPDSTSSVTLDEAKLVQDFINLQGELFDEHYDKDRIALQLEVLRNQFGRGLSPKVDLPKGYILQDTDFVMKKPRSQYEWNDRFKLTGKTLKQDVKSTEHFRPENF